MAQPRVPHFVIPFHFHDHGHGVQAHVVDQDTNDEIFVCVEAIARFPLGFRIEKTDFGMPDQTFTEGGVDEEEIRVSILNQEPRAEILVEHHIETYDELITNARIKVAAGGVSGRET